MGGTTGDLTPSDDRVLIDRIARRDPEALAELFDRYGRVVFGTLHQMLPGATVAAEVCQDVFLRFWRSAETYAATPAPIHHSLLRIAGNAATDWLRTHDGDASSLRRRVRLQA